MKIKKDRRNKGGYFHKVPSGTMSTEAKSFALRDISDYISKYKDFGNRNYVHIEYIILYFIKNHKPFINF